ncbi:MAG: hypothetical protein QXI60_10680 [Thermofilaceae archaeon]
MKRAKEIVLGEGSAALSLLVGIIALAFFPIPVVVYIFYLIWLAYVENQVHRWIQPLLTTWPRLGACGAMGLGLVARAWQLTPPNPNLLAPELNPLTFSFWTLILVGVGLFWFCVDAAKKLWRTRRE